MNIAIDSRILAANFRGGILVYTERLVEHLSQIDSENRYHLLFSGLRLDPDTIALNVGDNFRRTSLPVPDRGSKLTTTLWKDVALPAHFYARDIDVYHLPALHELTASRRVKKVFTVHDLRSTHLVGGDVEPQDLGAMRRSCRLADRIIAVSEFTRRDIIRQFRLPDHKVVTVPLGVDPQYKVVDDEAVLADMRQRLGLDKPFFLCLGLVPRKNIERLIAAYRDVRHRDEIDLVLAGHTGGPWVEKHRRRIADWGLEGSVKMPGAVSANDLILLYNSAFSFTFPSLCEGFGIPVLEAMACGAPVLTSNLSALPEVAGDAAILVDLYSQEQITRGMDRLAEDDDLRQRLRRDGIERAATFSWRRMAETIQQIYLTV